MSLINVTPPLNNFSGSYNDLTNLPSLGTMAAKNFTPISYQWTANCAVKNQDYVVCPGYHPGDSGYIFMYWYLTYENARPCYIRVEKFVSSGGNSDIITLAILDQTTNTNVGCTGMYLPVFDKLTTSSNYRVVCRQNQWDNASGVTGYLQVSGFIINT